MGRARMVAPVEPRLLNRTEAAAYCCVEPERFDRECPVPAVDLGDGIARWDRRGLDMWGSPQGIVYAVGFGDFVKIGFTAQGTKVRMADLQTGCPVKLKVLGEVQAPKSEEKWLHRRFDTYRLEGEWFLNEGWVRSWIEEGCPL